jgi:hypothetical protein
MNVQATTVAFCALWLLGSAHALAEAPARCGDLAVDRATFGRQSANTNDVTVLFDIRNVGATPFNAPTGVTVALLLTIPGSGMHKMGTAHLPAAAAPLVLAPGAGVSGHIQGYVPPNFHPPFPAMFIQLTDSAGNPTLIDCHPSNDRRAVN